LVLQLANLLFDSPDAMIRIDGSEFSEKHAISRLIGSPRGYHGHDEGGQLTDYVRRKPFSIVLVDEVEKASKEFCTLFLQVLDDGRLTDSQGRVVDFKNTVIIMTSNLGAQHLRDGSKVSEEKRNLVLGEIRRHFLPEFINRIDEVVIFRPLSRENIGTIVDIRLKELEKRLEAKKMTLDVEETVKRYLCTSGYSAEYGARPLNRMIQNEILRPLSYLILEDRIREGDTCKVRWNSDKGLIRIRPNWKAVAQDEEADVQEGLSF